MNTKKVLAVTAIALLSVPAYAAASYIVVGGLTEQVVEGHTVFAVIEKARFRNVTIEAAAVAVLVRERVQERENFKGVLWFNDQYLVSPYNIDSGYVRYPCGGAVMAVNSGDPDPRTMLVAYDNTDYLENTYGQFVYDEGGPGGPLEPHGDDDYDTLSQSGDYHWDEDTTWAGPPVPATTIVVWDGDDSPVGGNSPTGVPGNANVGVFDPDGLTNPTTLPTVYTNAATSVPFLYNYEESYLITDPNDHTWIIDKYTGITVDSLDLNTGTLTETTTTFPLWVVNILGKPVFTPDDAAASCPPFVDDPWQQAIINENFVIADEATCAVTTANGVPVCPSSPAGIGDDPNGDGVPLDGMDVKPPAIGYFEPTQTGGADEGTVSYCYEGNAQPRAGDATRPPGSGCDHQMTYLPPPPGEVLLFGTFDLADRTGNHPLRLYNALLYFYTEDCETGSNADDVVAVACFVPHGLDDTNGCQAYTEWHCPTWVFADTDGDGIPDAYVPPGPGGEDDNMEGNSHPFNPPGLYVPTTFDPTTGTPIAGTGEWYDFWAINRACSLGYSDTDVDANGQPVCNRLEHVEHDRGLIDIYYSATARPLEPPYRSFAELDYEGRIDEFHENNENPAAVPGEPGHPGTPDNDLAPFGIRR